MTTDGEQSNQALRDPVPIMMTPWERGRERLRCMDLPGQPFAKEVDDIVAEVHEDPVRALEILNAKTQEECEPLLRNAERLMLRRLQQEIATLRHQQSNPPGADQLISTEGNLHRFTRAADDGSKQLPADEVRGSNGGSGNNPTAQPLIAAGEQHLTELQKVLTDTPPRLRSKEITREALEDPDQRRQLIKRIAKQATCNIKAVGQLAGAVADNGTNTRRVATATLALQHSVARLEPAIEAIKGQLGHMASKLESLDLQVSLNKAPPVDDVIDSEEGAEPMEGVTGAEHPPAPIQPQLDQPTDHLPPDLHYGSVAGEWFVYKGSLAVRYQLWRKSVLEGMDPFPSAQNKVRLPNPSFSGDSNEIDPEMAILNFENWLTAAQVPRGQWATTGQTFLKGAAQRAYSAIALAAHARGQVPTWEQVTAIIRSFKRQDAQAVARAKLAKVQQTSTVAAYNRLFTELLVQVGSEPPAPVDLLNFYLQGLKSTQYLNPQGQPWASLEAAQEYHLQRELAQLSVQTHTHRPAHNKTSRFTPRLNAIATQNKQGSLGPVTPPFKRGGGRGGESGRGGRGGGGGRGAGGSSDWSAFGTGPELYHHLDKPCPHHVNRPQFDGHTKGACGMWHKAVAATKAAKNTQGR